MKKTTRYSLYERKDLNSRVLYYSNNKSEIKKVRTGWKHQMMFETIYGAIYNNIKKEWIP